MGALDNIGSSPSYASPREAAVRVAERAEAPFGTVGSVTDSAAKMANELLATERDRQEALSLRHPDDFGPVPAKAPEAPAAFDAKAFEDRFTGDYPKAEGLGELLAPLASRDPAFAKFLASFDAGEVFENKLYGGKAVAEIRRIYDAKGKHEEVQRDEKGAQAKQEGAQREENGAQKEQLKNSEGREFFLNEIQELLGAEKYAQVEADAKKAVANTGNVEAFRGVSKQDVMSAYLVANFGAISLGLPPEKRQAFESSVKNLDRSQDEAFQKLVSGLSEKDRKIAKGLYDETKVTDANGNRTKMAIIDPNGEKKFVIVDQTGKTPTRTVEKVDGEIRLNIGAAGEDGVSVVPPDDKERAEYARGLSAWYDKLPGAVRGVMPPGKLQFFLEEFAGRADSPLRGKHGGDPYNPDRGMDTGNMRAAMLFVEDIFKERLVEDPASPNPVPTGGALEPSAEERLRAKWTGFLKIFESGGMDAVERFLSKNWRDADEGGKDVTVP